MVTTRALRAYNVSMAENTVVIDVIVTSDDGVFHRRISYALDTLRAALGRSRFDENDLIAAIQTKYGITITVAPLDT